MDKELLVELDAMEKESLSDKAKTDRAKAQFINQIRNGLGEEIKKNPNKIVVTKKSLITRLFIKFRDKIIYIFKLF
jgi:hypothetical protein